MRYMREQFFVDIFVGLIHKSNWRSISFTSSILYKYNHGSQDVWFSLNPLNCMQISRNYRIVLHYIISIRFLLGKTNQGVANASNATHGASKATPTANTTNKLFTLLMIATSLLVAIGIAYTAVLITEKYWNRTQRAVGGEP